MIGTLSTLTRLRPGFFRLLSAPRQALSGGVLLCPDKTTPCRIVHAAPGGVSYRSCPNHVGFAGGAGQRRRGLRGGARAHRQVRLYSRFWSCVTYCSSAHMVKSYLSFSFSIFLIYTIQTRMRVCRLFWRAARALPAALHPAQKIKKFPGSSYRRQ